MKTNAEIKVQPKIRKKLFLFLLFFCFLVETGVAQLQDEAEKLLNRLDLSLVGLEKVKQSLDDHERAVEELLNYYRLRNAVRHPIDRNLKASLKGKIATEKDFETANNALKHIFVGQPAYPPYFCGDDIDWGTRPVPDNEWVWQLNRMSFWDAMGRVYWHTGDEKYAKAWGEQLMDWTRKNPNDEEHKYAWRSIEAGIRGYRWTGLFQRFIDSPSFTPDMLVVENKSYENLTHRRAVFFVDKRYFVIVDKAFGSATGDVASHFQLAPGGGDAIINRAANSVQTGFKEGWNVFVQTKNQPGLKLEEEESWVSFKYTEKEPRPAFCYSIKKESENSNVQFVSLVIPFEEELQEIQITRITEEPGKLEIEVLENGERKMIGYSMN